MASPSAATGPCDRATPCSPRPGDGRPRAAGRFLAVGDERLWLRGTTYGTFAPDAGGDRFPAPDRVAADLAAMAAAGITAVRTYTPPPRHLLDAALEAGVWVLAGLPWEGHVAFLDDRGQARDIVDRVGAMAATCAGHPALLGFAVGNEIPAGVVRWHGRRRVERFLGALADAVRAAAPGALVTYASFPSTEYLRLPGADFVSFNVYLEDPDRLERYLARLLNVAGDRPLVLSEIGLDSSRNGEAAQAAAVGRQVRSAFAAGCAGTFLFAWTDEWHRGADEVLDWDFGLTDRARRPKPALAAASDAYRDLPIAPAADAPLVSVVVCTYNGAATLRECLTGIGRLRHPRVEAIVVDDGSTDASAAIAAEFPVTLIRTENRGLSAARTTGLHAASGDIVAYIDDDAWPDPDWLTYLVDAFGRTGHAGIGGPNLPPDDESAVATCVANAPGGPVHVLLSDTVAEHIPGCNMAFRRDRLLAAGGFDERFRVAGDDVDVCWALQERGETLGFHPGAVVWHRRRSSLRAYWRQQRGYGRAEALLERKWPDKYNVPGHAMWQGRLYGRGLSGLVRRSRIYHGTFGSSAFQPEVDRPVADLLQITAAPDWYLLCGALAALAALAASWHTLLAAVPMLVVAVLATVAHAVRGARGAELGLHGTTRPRALALRAVVAALHLAQPAARLAGRVRDGLTPWRRPRLDLFVLPRVRAVHQAFAGWAAPEERVTDVERALQHAGARVRHGGGFDRWDLDVAGGALGAARLTAVVEEHGRGRQLVRWRLVPRVARAMTVCAGALAALLVGAIAAQAAVAVLVLLTLLVTALTAAVRESGMATAQALHALGACAEARPEPRPLARSLRLAEEPHP